MPEEFVGVHSEWNMGSPGGWDYQRMAQEIGQLAWKEIQQRARLDIELDFTHPILNPVPNFARLLLRAHRKKFPQTKPFIALVAEKETLAKVGENIRFVEYLNGLGDVRAVLIDPSNLELKDGKVCFRGERLTTIFLDFNNRIIVQLKRRYNLQALLAAIKEGIVINPRGMEPLGAKGLFEAITGEYKEQISRTTLQRTPWTRLFFPRKTIGPSGEEITDLVQWVRENWTQIVLKPVHGYSGKGIIIGHKEVDKEGAIQQAQAAGDYIVQPLIPLHIWAEEFPWIDRENKRLFLKRWQTDFRCFITDAGLIGFVTRFGGIPTNVGSGGGVQSTAILRSRIPLDVAIEKINQSILDLGYDFISGLQRELDQRSIAMGNVYLLGPIMCTLRPRIITPVHIEQLKVYAQNLWRDALTMERLWREGRLNKYVQISAQEEEIARLAPWQGSPALIAADGLFRFV